MRERMLWVGIGVLSLLLAAALGLATSKLTEAPVGLSAEPVSAGEALAPAPTASPEATREPRKRRPPPPPPPPPAPPRPAGPPPPATSSPVPAPPVETDDDSGSGSDDDSGSDD